VRAGLRAAVGTYAASVGLAAALLPARVPLHFGASGAVDRYGSRTEALVHFGLLGVGLLAVWAGCHQLVRRVGLQLVNVPHADYWKAPEREPELRTRLQVDLDRLFAATFLLCAVIAAATLVAARGDGRLPWWFGVGFAAYLLWTAREVWHLTTRRYRPPADPAPP